MPDVLMHLTATFLPAVLMLSIVITNHVVAGQRTDKRIADESARFVTALAAELRAMLELYQVNLGLIEQKADYLLSSRTSIVIYKGNLGRLTSLLDRAAIEPVVRVFAQNERIESVVAAHSNFKCNLTYQFPPNDDKFAEWKQMYECASLSVDSACRILEGLDELASASATKTEPWRSAVDQMIDLARDTGPRRWSVERSN
jgi:hypothetical protein